MKSRNIFKGVLAMLFMAVAFIALGSFLTPVGAILAVVGAPIVGKAVATDNILTGATNLLRPEISQKITQMNPSRTFLDTVLSMIAPVKSNSWEHKFYAVENRPFRDTVNGAYTGVSATSASICVDNINMWTINDTIYVGAVTSGVTPVDGGLVLYVYDKDIDTSTLKVQAVNTTNLYIPSIGDEAVLTRMGQGKYQNDAQTENFQMLPAETVQYNQIFMAQIEEGEYAAMHNKEVDFGFLDYAKQVLYDFKATRELSMLFGAKQKITDKKTGKDKYLTGGLTRYVGQNLTYGVSSNKIATLDNITTWCKSIFAGNAGSQTKLVFCGSGLMEAIMKVKQVNVNATTANNVTVDAVLKHLNGNEAATNLGVKLKPIESEFGTLYLHYSALLDEAGWADNGIVIDPAHIEKAVMLPMRKRKIDLKGSGQALVQAEVLEEISSLIVRYPDTHATIKPA